MEYRRLGRSGLQLSALSFGSWVTFHGQIEDKHAGELMGIAYDRGINFFDNAEAYAELGPDLVCRVFESFDWLKRRWLKEDRIGKVEQLKTIAAELDTGLPALAIAWTVANPNVTTAILGTTAILQNKPHLDMA